MRKRIRFISVLTAVCVLSGTAVRGAETGSAVTYADGATGKECAHPLTYWPDGTDSVSLPPMDYTAERDTVKIHIGPAQGQGISFMEMLDKALPGEGWNNQDKWKTGINYVRLQAVDSDGNPIPVSKNFTWPEGADKYPFVRSDMDAKTSHNNNRLRLYGYDMMKYRYSGTDKNDMPNAVNIDNVFNIANPVTGELKVRRLYLDISTGEGYSIVPDDTTYRFVPPADDELKRFVIELEADRKPLYPKEVWWKTNPKDNDGSTTLTNVKVKTREGSELPKPNIDRIIEINRLGFIAEVNIGKSVRYMRVVPTGDKNPIVTDVDNNNQSLSGYKDRTYMWYSVRKKNGNMTSLDKFKIDREYPDDCVYLVYYSDDETVTLDTDENGEIYPIEPELDGCIKVTVMAGKIKFNKTIRDDQPQGFEQRDVYMLPGEETELGVMATKGSTDYLNGYSRWYQWRGNTPDDTTQYRWVKRHLSMDRTCGHGDNNATGGAEMSVYDKGLVTFKGGVAYMVYRADATVKEGVMDTVGWDFISYTMDNSGKDSIPPVSLRRQYVIRDAGPRYKTLQANKDSLDKYRQVDGKSPFRPWEYPQFFIEQYEIHVPRSTNEVNFRLAERLDNYYISTDGDKRVRRSNCPTKVRWRLYDETGKVLTEQIAAHSYDIVESRNKATVFCVKDTSPVEEGQRIVRYITAEVAKGDDRWYPVSLQTVMAEPYAEPHTQAELEALAYHNENPAIRDIYTNRLQDTMNATLHLLNKIDFDGVDNDGDGYGDDIMTRTPKPAENYRLKPVGGFGTVALSSYAFANLDRYDIDKRPLGWRTVGRGEYALYHTLNIGGISSKSEGYRDWWANDKDKYRYPVLVYDRTHEESVRKGQAEKYGYFFYVDAADEAGIITTLPIEGGLCPNTRILVSAWILELCHNKDASKADVGFTFRGIREDGTKTVLNRFYSGNMTPKPGYDDVHAKPHQLKAEWQQVYFWFDFSGDMADYESYELEVASNCLNSDGADFAIDDICVYRTDPNVKVVRAGKCNTSDIVINATYSDLLANFALEYGGMVLPDEDADRLTGISRYMRFGLEENEANVYIAMADDRGKWMDGIRYNGKESVVTQYGRMVMPTDTSGLTRLDAKDPARLEEMVDSINREKNLDALQDYKEWYARQDKERQNELPDTAGLTPMEMFNTLKVPPIQYVYRTTGQTRDGVHLTNIRHYQNDTELRPGEWYTIIAHSSLVLKEIDINDPCALTQRFRIETFIDLSTDSESGLTEGFCLNSKLKVIASLNSPKGPVSSEHCGFDWWLGAYDEEGYRSYVDEVVWVNDTHPLSIEDALGRFHKALGANADSTQLLDLNNWKPDNEEDRKVWDFLNELIVEEMLLLNRWSFDTRLKYQENYMVAIPFLRDENWSEKEFLCLTPEELKIKTSAVTPEVKIGVPGVTYPSADFDPAIRMGLEHVKMFTGSADGQKHGLRIHLRSVDFQWEEADSLGYSVFDTIGGSAVYFDAVQLTATTEKNCQMMINDSVGRVTGIHYDSAKPDDGYIMVELNGKFIPREGCSYTLSVPYQEFKKGSSNRYSCTGLLELELKIVPEYLTWAGGDDDSAFPSEWNRDANWRRSSESETYMGLKREDVDANPLGSGRSDGLEAAFAPLYFSHVTLDGSRCPELYDCGGGTMSGVAALADGSDMIVYDMVVGGSDGVPSLGTYGANACREVLFKPGATLPGAQYLEYDTARVEMEMKNMQPYWLAMPLYGVVAGDVYSPEYDSGMKGRQETPAFETILYGRNTPNYRFNPAYYQRAWEKAVHIHMPGNAVDTFELTQSGWSVDYNDVDVRYQPGCGFYARVEMGDLNNTGLKSLLRFPKGDVRYSYENIRQNAPAPTRGMAAAYAPSQRDIDRTRAGRLASDEPEITVRMDSIDADRKYLFVGNPYMAYLDMEKFFLENEDVIEPRYWSIEDGAPTLTNRTDNAWVQAGVKTGEAKISPMQAFFVEARESADRDDEIKFTPDMTADEPMEVIEDERARIITLTAENENEGCRSEAVIVGNPAAKTGYAQEEDAAMLYDDELAYDMPAAYSVAGGKVLSVNTTSFCSNVPIGVYNNAGGKVRLTIGGIDRWDGSLSLYDALTGMSIPLNGESYTIEIDGESHGRYFLREVRLDGGREDGAVVYSPSEGTAVVAATLPMESIRLYTTDGMFYDEIKTSGNSSCPILLPRGIYIFKIEMEGVTETHKVYVK